MGLALGVAAAAFRTDAGVLSGVTLVQTRENGILHKINQGLGPGVQRHGAVGMHQSFLGIVPLQSAQSLDNKAGKHSHVDDGIGRHAIRFANGEVSHHHRLDEFLAVKHALRQTSVKEQRNIMGRICGELRVTSRVVADARLLKNYLLSAFVARATCPEAHR